MTIFMNINCLTVSWAGIIGSIGGIIGIIAGLWALFDRYKNRIPRIIVFAPYQFTAIDAVTGKNILSIFFRFSNLSQTPTFLYIETLKAELYYDDLQEWKKVSMLKLLTEKISTDFSKEMNVHFGINKVKNIDVFDENIIKYGYPLCGYLTFQIENKKYSKLRGEVIDSRQKKIKFNIDFKDQKKYDPASTIEK